MSSGRWGEGGLSSLGLGVPRGLRIYPPLASPRSLCVGTCQPAAPRGIRAPAAGALRPDCGRRVRQRRGAPGAGSGSLLPTSPAHPWAEAAPEAGRPGATRRGQESRSPRSPAAGAARSSSSAPPCAPHTEGRTRPSRQSPLPPPPRQPEPRPRRRGAGVSDLKTHLLQPRPDWHPKAAAPGQRGDGWPHPPGPRFLPPPSAGRKSLGRGRLSGKPVPLPLSLAQLVLEDAQTLHLASPAGERSKHSRRHTPAQTTAPREIGGSGLPLPSLLFKARPSLGGTEISVWAPGKKPHCAVQAELGDCPLWASATPGNNG